MLGNPSCGTRGFRPADWGMCFLVHSGELPGVCGFSPPDCKRVASRAGRVPNASRMFRHVCVSLFRGCAAALPPTGYLLGRSQALVTNPLTVGGRARDVLGLWAQACLLRSHSYRSGVGCKVCRATWPPVNHAPWLAPSRRRSSLLGWVGDLASRVAASSGGLGGPKGHLPTFLPALRAGGLLARSMLAGRLAGDALSSQAVGGLQLVSCGLSACASFIWLGAWQLWRLCVLVVSPVWGESPAVDADKHVRCMFQHTGPSRSSIGPIAVSARIRLFRGAPPIRSNAGDGATP